MICLDSEVRAEKRRTAQLFQETDARLREFLAAAAAASAAAAAAAAAAATPPTASQGQPADPMAGGNDGWSTYLGKGRGGFGAAGAPAAAAPETFRMHTPPPAQGGQPAWPTDAARTGVKWALYDEKYVLAGKGAYQPKSPQLWLQDVRDYLAGRCSDMDRVLDWVESHRD